MFGRLQCCHDMTELCVTYHTVICCNMTICHDIRKGYGTKIILEVLKFVSILRLLNRNLLCLSAMTYPAELQLKVSLRGPLLPPQKISFGRVHFVILQSLLVAQLVPCHEQLEHYIIVTYAHVQCVHHRYGLDANVRPGQIVDWAQQVKFLSQRVKDERQLKVAARKYL